MPCLLNISHEISNEDTLWYVSTLGIIIIRLYDSYIGVLYTIQILTMKKLFKFTDALNY